MSVKLNLAVAAVVFCSLVIPCVGFAAAPDPDTTMLLDGTWKFSLARTPPMRRSWAAFTKRGSTQRASKQFLCLQTGRLKGFEQPTYGQFRGDASEGFYLDQFTVPAKWTGRRVLLHFGGVWSSAEVWLNGQPIGRHDSGFTSFSYDVSSILHFDAPNQLAVRVRQKTHDYTFDTNDDWALGGIFRSVLLESMPGERWIDRVEVTTTFDSQFRDAD